MAVLEHPARQRPLTERINAGREGNALLSWLALMGWKVELDRDDAIFVGVAHHITSDGTDLAICATARTRVDVIWMLFERAIEALGSTQVVEEDLLGRHSLVA